ncbi:porin [Pedobacter yulinensis]|uniref:Porin n=1 Tax=Pedobacter yulinensis TaxID=2126353 RepID=A0A2T3HHQ2_9SPHI|nr:porin [Pedobacter yulinensis]PST81962.1 porin [Pedobacter yulinensis]
MKIRNLLLSLFVCAATSVSAQDSTAVNPLVISGSVDTYFKYDFSKRSNIQTSFATDHNSVSLGMVNLTMKKSVGKASFVGDLSFGPRGQGQSILNAAEAYSETSANSFHIQNLYVSYAFTDKFSMTAGFMGTFVGYEVISPVGNFNYSTSYLFSSGPFQNAGIKANYSFSDRVGIMVGLFNDWNKYQDFNGVSDFGAQLMVSPVDGWTAYLNVITGYPSGTEFDLTTSYQISNKFKLGLNAADYTMPDKAGGFSGAALYPQYAFTDAFALGLRGEYFKAKSGTAIYNVAAGSAVTALTLSANIKAGPLTLIPELRFDNGEQEIFYRGRNSAAFDTKQASQFSLAAVYSF